MDTRRSASIKAYSYSTERSWGEMEFRYSSTSARFFLADYFQTLADSYSRMINADPRAVTVFMKDVDDTYNHIVTRVKANLEEEEELSKGAEQIQLVPENPDAEISFNVPDGPPPENIKLEGPGTEDMDVVQVRKALQVQWDVFDGFGEDLQTALKSQKLEAVNKVLGSMKIEEAERVVQLLQISGILSFSENGIRDQTGESTDDVD